MADPSLILDLVEKASGIVEKGLEYKSTREILKSTTENLGPLLQQIEQRMKEIDLPTEPIQKLKGLTEANQEVLDKYKIHWWNFCLAPYFQSKHDEAYQSLLRYCSVQLQLLMVKYLTEIQTMLTSDHHSRRSQTIPLPTQETDNNTMPIFNDSLQVFSKFTVRLDGQLHFMNELKHKLLNGDEQVLNLYGLAGSGKTTLAEKICLDLQVKGKFNDGIIFVKLGSQIRSNEAINKVQDKLSKFGVHPVLLVLDDVWPALENIVEKIKDLISSDSKILVTSRVQITTLGTVVYPMELLSERDAETLFLHFVHPSNIDFGGKEKREILLQIVKGCKGLPLAIEFIGRKLRGKGIEEFQKVQLEWSLGDSILDSNAELLANLQSSLHLLVDESIRECFMDLGLFPEDQKIPITALIDMWIELYNLDERGIYAMTFIHKLTALNLAAGIKVRRIVGSDADNYYNNHFLMQHDLFRELAIRISNEQPFEGRRRLIIDMNGNHRPEWWPHQQRQGILAHTLSYFTKWLKDSNQHRVAAPILSISSDQNTISDWCNIQAADAVVLILNLKTTEYMLPEFVKKMRNLRVLILTNYGLHPTKLKNLGLLGSLWRLKRIRLEQVSLPYLCKLNNVHKLSLYMCEVKNAFENSSIEFSKVMPNLVDLNIEYCKDLEKLPARLCNIVTLRKLSISSCHKFTELPQEIGKLENLELLRISYCAEFKEMPESITKLKRLSFFDISYCVNLRKLPGNFGELRSLRKLYMMCCPIRELPESINHMEHLESVICDEDSYSFWEVIRSIHSRLNIKMTMDIGLNWLS